RASACLARSLNSKQPSALHRGMSPRACAVLRRWCSRTRRGARATEKNADTVDHPETRKGTQKMSNRASTWISDWNPEDEKFWQSTGKFIARRNLIWSIFAEHLGFSIWLLWSIVATKLPQAGFHYTTDQLFQLVALPGLIGSLMRFPYTFAVTTFGGRNWT